jgi:hypothetical protein
LSLLLKRVMQDALELAKPQAICLNNWCLVARKSLGDVASHLAEADQTKFHAPPSTPSTARGEIGGPRPLCPVHECFVGLVEVVRDGDDGEKGGYEAGDPRREYEAVHEERGHPHPEAELARQQLAY